MKSASIVILCSLGMIGNCPLIQGAFYLPGVTPKTFSKGEAVPLDVNKLTSVRTQLPYEYFDLPFCSGIEKGEERAENLGEILSGDAIRESGYELRMLEQSICNVLCRRRYNNDEMKRFASMIEDEYHVHWILDNLPVAFFNHRDDEQGHQLVRGFPLGFTEQGKHYINNHVRIILSYNAGKNPETGETDFDGYRIVGFSVEPRSIKHAFVDNSVQDKAKLDGLKDLRTCNIQQGSVDGQFQDVDGDGEIIFTYDVQWLEDLTTKWSNRWDPYLSSADPNDQIHWFSIINSFMIVLFLTGMIAMIMLRTLHRDIAKYNDLSQEDPQEETGWKLVHGDVFRPPQFSPLLFSVFVGTGVQISAMAGSTMVFALLGFLSPANRGGLLTAFLLLFVFMGSLSGFYAARIYKMFHGKDWKRCTILTATVFPGIIFTIFFVLNLFVWGKGSSGAVPFGTLFALLVLWFGISVPLVFLGSYFGFRKEGINFPVRTNQIARQIPEQMWYLSPWFSILVGGILPFGAVFIELFFIMSSLWLHQIYYVFGFLTLVLAILIATCAEVTIVMCYFQLCAEDYRWWWRSFLTSGSAALYLYLYSFLYFFTKLQISGFVSSLVYYGYMGIISITFFFLTGTIGFISCLWFVTKIYSSIKID